MIHDSSGPVITMIGDGLAFVGRQYIGNHHNYIYIYMECSNIMLGIPFDMFFFKKSVCKMLAILFRP